MVVNWTQLLKRPVRQGATLVSTSGCHLTKNTLGVFEVPPLRGTEEDQQELAHRITALLVHDHGEHLARFEEALRLHKVELTHARTCREVSQAIQQSSPPLLIFTDTRLSDGSFQDILKLAAKAEKFVNVLVVSKVGNITLYMEAMEGGAFDFLTPNIEPSRFPPIFLSAAADAVDRRSRQSQEAWCPFSRRPASPETVAPHTKSAESSQVEFD